MHSIVPFRTVGQVLICFLVDFEHETFKDSNCLADHAAVSSSFLIDLTMTNIDYKFSGQEKRL